MQQFNISTSEANKQVVTALTSRLSLAKENVIPRIAFAYSIAQKGKLNIDDIKDSKGKSYKDDTLFGRYKDYYVALACQHYQLHKSDPNIGKYIKMHIDDGLEKINLIFNENPHFTAFDFLSTEVERGIGGLESADMSFEPIIYSEDTKHLKVKDKVAYENLIEIEVGKILEGESIKFRVNDVNIHNNQHIAVAGASGTGKTQFALEFLRQMNKETNGQVSFVYLDFKGLKGDDLERSQPFFDKTNTTFIDCPQKPFPLNPLSFIDKDNETNLKMGVGKFVDIISSFANIGKNKEQALREATLSAFESHKKDGKYPSMKEILDFTTEIEGDKPSTLRNILFSLSDYTIFESEVDPLNTFLDRNHYFSLSGDLPSEIRFTATFLIVNYIYNTFMNMANTNVENGVVGMRYVFLIDEAHNVFNNKKAQGLLDKILREIRSKGVSVFLLSQGIEEFNQPDIDFSSNCETAFLLDIKDKSNVRLMSKFLGASDKDSNQLVKSMSGIKKGQSISNLKEFESLTAFELRQLNT